ncbi:MAG: T9SS type A sorting domain-containing protein [Saprospiraceae bacterium]
MRLSLYCFFLTLIVFQSYGQITYQSKLQPEYLQLQQFDAGSLVNIGQLEPTSLIFTDEDELNGISYLRTFLNRDGLANFNSSGWLTTQLYNGIGGTGTFDLSGGTGTGLIFSAGPDASNAARGYVSVFDNGSARTNMYVNFNGAGLLETIGPNGSYNTGLSSPSSLPNNGYIFCVDPNGFIQTGMIVNADGTGEVFGNTKSFRMAHPKRPGKEIWYASLEGPEAAAYERGSANLQYGEAFIPFSDHFQLVVNPETMTVILTPHSADTYGLAVIEKTAKGIRVKELKGGRGNFGFDWEVKGVRQGYEDFRVIRDASEVLPAGYPSVRTIQGDQSTPQNQDSAEAEVNEAQPSFSLGQNRPNPARNRTLIPYAIPASSQSAEIRIFDAGGKLIQRHKLSPTESGTLEISNEAFSSGMYTYSLVIDGELKASRQMVIVR